MSTIISVIQLPILLLAGLMASYILVITIAPLVILRRKRTPPTTRKKFAIIIPAHNEEKVIARTLASANEIAYPHDHFDTIVVADNCTDDTAKIALASGAIVFERFEPARRGKGHALNWIMPQILNRLNPYDACVFVDADTIISADFLEEMNGSLHEGHRVIQSSDLVLENKTSWRVQLVLLAFALQNYVRPLGKSLLGLSVGLKGNGMCFSSDIIRMMRWDEKSIGEDIDMGLELIRRGIRIHFNPRATVYALMPTQAASAETQRLRWEGGRFSTIRTRIPSLFAEAWQKKSLYLFEAALDAAFPPLALFFVVSLSFILFNGMLSWSGWVDTTLPLIAWAVILGSLIVHCVLGLVIARVPLRSLLAFLYVPTFLVWKIGVYLKMMGQKGNKEWVRTAR